jgi:hypothetical protein
MGTINAIKLTITSHSFNQSIGILGNRIKKIPPTLIYNLNDRTVYEQLLVHRLNEELSAKHGLSNSRYGFRQGVSTIDAVEKVCKTAKQEMQKTLKTRSLCAMLMIDVKNAFNSASWQMIIEELRRKGISHYLVEVIKSYLSIGHSF